MTNTPQAHPELSREYFEREARKGRRVIFLWHVSKRWPKRDPATYVLDQYIEGFEFRSEDAAMHFEVAEHYVTGESFSTWAEAEEWLRDTATQPQEGA